MFHCEVFKFSGEHLFFRCFQTEEQAEAFCAKWWNDEAGTRSAYQFRVI